MDTLAPRTSRIALMLAFALSCIGLLVFLWIQFGGSVPLAPSGYRFSAEFAQATELGVQDDVEIAGVTVGRVVAVRLDRATGLTRAEIEIDHRYAPRPADTRAILRQKSLLGETYVALSPGNPNGPMLADGATLPRGQVSATVSLDQILNTLDPRTRAAFRTWMQDGGMALSGQGQAFNGALAQLEPFGTNVGAVLAVLLRDRAAAASLLGHGATVFSALAASPQALGALVSNADTVFTTTAAHDRALAATVRAFPAFLRTARAAVLRLGSFSRSTQTLIDRLDRAAPALSGFLERLVPLAPSLRQALIGLGPLNAASRAGIPALGSALNQTVALLRRARPYLGGVVPIIDYLDRFRRELAAFFANASATTQATSASLLSSRLTHYLRISAPVNPESLTAYAQRPSSNRSNPYMAPGGYRDLLSGLASFGTYLCTAQPLPAIAPSVPASLARVLSSVYFTNDPSGPACRAQAPLALSMSYPHPEPLQ